MLKSNCKQTNIIISFVQTNLCLLWPMTEKFQEKVIQVKYTWFDIYINIYVVKFAIFISWNHDLYLFFIFSIISVLFIFFFTQTQFEIASQGYLYIFIYHKSTNTQNFYKIFFKRSFRNLVVGMHFTTFKKKTHTVSKNIQFKKKKNLKITWVKYYVNLFF